MKKSHEMDMTNGPILKKIILFAIPLIVANVLQVLFKAADIAVLGKFAPADIADSAIAGVGATGALIELIVGLFSGLAIGTNVLVSRAVGAKDPERAKKLVGTSVLISVIFGTALTFVGWFGAYTFLTWMHCDLGVIDLATKYLKIYFLGMPIMMLYNFSAAILRAVGDTLRPLIYLTIGGIVNVGLNIYFVVGIGKDVEGVAIATVASQAIAAVLAVIALFKTEGYGKLVLSRIRVYGNELKKIVRIGLPSGVQGCVFSLANVLIQASINELGKATMAANTVAAQFDGIIYFAMNGVSLATTAFVSQNYGANDLKRIKRTVLSALVVVSVVGISLSAFVVCFSRPLCSIITETNGDPQVIDIAVLRLRFIAGPYVLCGIMEIFACSLNGLGRTVRAMVVSLSGCCVFRILWLNTVFRVAKLHTYSTVMAVYPVSWFITACVQCCMLFLALKKLKGEFQTENSET